MTIRPVEREDIMAVLRRIDDPELPISIVDLGLVEHLCIEGGSVDIDLVPTFIGCPALDMIEGEVREQVAALAGVETVTVRFRNDPPWSVDRISTAGRQRLAEHGVTVADSGSRLAVAGHEPAAATVTLQTSAIPCPYCYSTRTRMESPFGPTRCRQIFYCDACRTSFEHMRSV